MLGWGGEFEPELSFEQNLHVLSFNMEIFKGKKFTAHSSEEEVHKKVTGPNSAQRKIKSTLGEIFEHKFSSEGGGGQEFE